jgi:hypothetical protein
VIDKIYNMLGKPRVCPHGNPIYGKPEGVRLSKSYPGRVIVTAVAELKSVLGFLASNRISINDTLTVIRRRKGNVTVEFNGRQIIIDDSIASGIIVMESR